MGFTTSLLLIVLLYLEAHASSHVNSQAKISEGSEMVESPSSGKDHKPKT